MVKNPNVNLEEAENFRLSGIEPGKIIGLRGNINNQPFESFQKISISIGEYLKKPCNLCKFARSNPYNKQTENCINKPMCFNSKKQRWDFDSKHYYIEWPDLEQRKCEIGHSISYKEAEKRYCNFCQLGPSYLHCKINDNCVPAFGLERFAPKKEYISKRYDTILRISKFDYDRKICCFCAEILDGGCKKQQTCGPEHTMWKLNKKMFMLDPYDAKEVKKKQ